MKRRYDELPPQDGRRVIRCLCCNLVQFKSPSGMCVKSRKLLEHQPRVEIKRTPVRTFYKPFYDFALAIRMCRIAADRSQSDVCLEMGVPRTWLSQVECGNRIPHIRTFERVAVALGMSPAGLAQVAMVLGSREAMP